jgi:iron complex outermembrane recepter protein
MQMRSGWKRKFPGRTKSHRLVQAMVHQEIARFTTSTLALVSLASFGPSLAAETPTDDSFSGTALLPPAIHVTRLNYSEFDAPEAVTVITQEDIRLAGYLEVSEIFRAVPGFRIAKIGPETRLSYHGTAVRQNRRMQVTIDGRNALIGDGQYVEFNRLPIDINDIARVIITRGPNGAAYGDNAFLASIAFETIGPDNAQGVSVRAGGGYNDRARYGVSANQTWGKFNFAFAVGRNRDSGYDYQDEIRSPRKDDKRVERGHLGIEYAETDRSKWRLDANAYDSEHQSMISSLLLDRMQENDGQFISLSNRREISESSRFDWLISHNRQEERSQNIGCFDLQTATAFLSAIADPTLRMLFLQTPVVPGILGVPVEDTCFIMPLDAESDRTDLEIEYEFRTQAGKYLFGASGSTINASSAEYFANQPQEQQIYRVFGETAYTLGNVNLSLGAMGQDADNVSKTQVAWRGAANWQLRREQMLRYSYARSFRIPSLVETETLWAGEMVFGRRGEALSTYRLRIPLPLITNRVAIRPETIESHALGYFGSLLNSGTVIDIKLFDEKIRRPVESNIFYFSSPPFNARAYSLSGAELELSTRLNEQWRIKGQYSYLDTDASSMFERGLYGKHAGSLSVTYRPIAGHDFTIAYYRNSTISGNSYDRYDLAYNHRRNFGQRDLHLQAVLQHHIGGVDGIDGAGPFQTEESYYIHRTQIFVFAELTF